jgi:hypothetical protein
VSRRDDWTQALCVALVKDRGVTAADALRVLELAAALPDDSFPEMTAAGVVAFVQHGLREGAAPGWVAEVREGEARNIRVTSTGTASSNWTLAARQLYDELPEVFHPLFVGNSMVRLTRDEWDELVAWVRGVPGWQQGDAPFIAIAERKP